MAKVLTFPVKKHLTPEIEESLYEVGKAYLVVLYDALKTLSSDDPTQEEMDEIRDLVFTAYAKGVNRALKEIEEEL